MNIGKSQNSLSIFTLFFVKEYRSSQDIPLNIGNMRNVMRRFWAGYLIIKSI